MSFKLLLGVICCIPLLTHAAKLTSVNKENGNKEAQTNEISKQIEMVQAKLAQIDIQTLQQQNVDISNLQKSLNHIQQKITEIEQTMKKSDKISSNLKIIETRITEMESKTDTITSCNTTDTSAAMSREIDRNTRKMDALDETQDTLSEDMQNMKSNIKRMDSQISQLTQQSDANFKAMDKRFAAIQKGLANLNRNIEDVYELTLPATVTRLGNDISSYLYASLDYVKNIDYRTKFKFIFDPKQRELLGEWFKGMVKYVTFWWSNVYKPAIKEQAIGVKDKMEYIVGNVNESIAYVHGHFAYQEFTRQAAQYLDMINVPSEYYGLCVDGILVVFCLSSLMTAGLIALLLCDCCCPVDDTHMEVDVATNTNNRSRRGGGGRRTRTRRR